MKAILLAAFALTLSSAHAQLVTSPVSPALEVRRLAPQLVAFAGGETNFANLVNGLALGVPVTLTTPTTAGGVQAFSFAPAGTMTPLQIAQLLESARQSLIARGVATPNAQQLGAMLTSGNPLVSSATPAGAPTIATQSPAVAIQGATAPAPGPNAAAGSSTRNVSDSPFPRGISDTPPLPVPGVRTPVPGTTTNASPLVGTTPSVNTVAPSAAR